MVCLQISFSVLQRYYSLFVLHSKLRRAFVEVSLGLLGILSFLTVSFGGFSVTFSWFAAFTTATSSFWRSTIDVPFFCKAYEDVGRVKEEILLALFDTVNIRQQKIEQIQPAINVTVTLEDKNFLVFQKFLDVLKASGCSAIRSKTGGSSRSLGGSVMFPDVRIK